MKNNYNITIVKYTHSMAWWETAELIFYALKQLGFKVKIQHQFLEMDCVNIILGAFLLEKEYLKKLPKNSIILNTEQLLFESDFKKRWPSSVIEWAKEYETWDYSEENIEVFKKNGINNVKKLDIGYQPELNRIKKNENQDIDVLFYGSRNQKRVELLDKLKKTGLKIEVLFGVYGLERDKYIERSKVVLNCHNYKSEIFEIIRCFYLMTNSKAIVSEINLTTKINQFYRNGIYATPYEQIIDSCVYMVKNNEQREELEQRALSTIKQMPQAEFIKKLIQYEPSN